MPDEVKVVLKYCEGCGALGLRPAENGSAYCASCRVAFERKDSDKPQHVKNGGRP